MTVRRHAPVLLAACAGALALAWLAGFVWFVHGALRAETGRSSADGIVVLTGGADRIAAGIRLLQQGRGQVLLISGVGHGADLADLLRGTGIDPEPLQNRITLGRAATTTAGNADETAAWVRQQRLGSLLVVTAGYHMQRALTELQRSLPGLKLVAAPVLPSGLLHRGSLRMLRLLATEYSKFLAAELGLGRLGAA